MGTRCVRLCIRSPVVHFDDRRDAIVSLSTHAEPHFWTNPSHPFLWRQIICREICEAYSSVNRGRKRRAYVTYKPVSQRPLDVDTIGIDRDD